MMLVIFPPVDPKRLDAITAAAGGLSVCNAATHEEALAAMPSARAFLGKVTPRLLAAANDLQWVQAPTASLEHYVFPELVAHSCVLSNCRGLFGDVIAEHVFGGLLSFTRNLHHYRDRQRQRRYEPVGAEELVPDFAGGPHACTPVDKAHRRLAECSLLVVGCGGIGQEVIRRASAWGVFVEGVDAKPASVDRVTVHPVDALSDVIGGYDFVVIAAPHTPSTEGLFDGPMIGRMKRGAALVNVGRGAIVKLDAVTEALRSGHLGGAMLDVFEEEPLPDAHPLWSEPNAILTPHVAACCTAIHERHLETLVDNVGRFARGEPVGNVVDKAQWY